MLLKSIMNLRKARDRFYRSNIPDWAGNMRLAFQEVAEDLMISYHFVERIQGKDEKQTQRMVGEDVMGHRDLEGVWYLQDAFKIIEQDIKNNQWWGDNTWWGYIVYDNKGKHVATLGMKKYTDPITKKRQKKIYHSLIFRLQARSYACK